MKKNLILSIAILAMSCCPQKNAIKTNSETTNTSENVVLKTVEGEVLAINLGKDGYTAKIQSGSIIYFVTISHSNLNEPSQYKSVNVGDKLKVSGDFWQMENENQITVREIL